MSPVDSQAVCGFSRKSVTIFVNVSVLAHVRLHFADTLECRVHSFNVQLTNESAIETNASPSFAKLVFDEVVF